MPKPFSAMKHRAVLGYGAQVHMVENRNCTDARLRELVEGYQAVVVQPYSHPIVIAGQGTVMVLSIKLPISTSCWRKSAVEAYFPVSVARHSNSYRAWSPLPVSRLAPWMRWTRSSRTVSFPCPTRIRLPMASDESCGADLPDSPSARDGVLCGWRRGNSTGNAIRL